MSAVGRSRRARVTAALVAGLLVGGGTRSPDLLAQEARDVPGAGALRVAVRLSADTVRVGEPFTMGIVAVARDTIRFAPLLDRGDDWEQLDVARVDRGPARGGATGAAGEAGEVRAYYRIVAWESGRLELPDLGISIGRRPGRELRVDLPAPFVRSVLPADAEEPRLRGPRDLIRPGFPWLLVLALLLLAALAARWWRRRRGRAADAEPAVVTERPDAADRAREALVTLRARVESGEIGAAEFYDRLEVILREYLADTRAWPATRPVRASPSTTRGAMRQLQRHAMLSRFGGVEADDPRLLADVNVSIDWLGEDAA